MRPSGSADGRRPPGGTRTLVRRAGSRTRTLVRRAGDGRRRGGGRRAERRPHDQTRCSRTSRAAPPTHDRMLHDASRRPNPWSTWPDARRCEPLPHRVEHMAGCSTMRAGAPTPGARVRVLREAGWWSVSGSRWTSWTPPGVLPGSPGRTATTSPVTTARGTNPGRHDGTADQSRRSPRRARDPTAPPTSSPGVARRTDRPAGVSGSRPHVRATRPPHRRPSPGVALTHAGTDLPGQRKSPSSAGAAPGRPPPISVSSASSSVGRSPSRSRRAAVRRSMVAASSAE